MNNYYSNSTFLKRVMGKIKRLVRDKKIFQLRDEIIFRDLTRKTKQNSVNIHWCSDKRDDGKENVGDSLSLPIVEYMLNYYHIDSEKKIKQTKHLYALGSILFFGDQDATVWGSGILVKPIFHTYYPNYDIRLVRGPETRRILMEMKRKKYYVPEVYGDPAVIMPMIYTPDNEIKKYQCGLVFHKNSNLYYTKECHIIDIMVNDYRVFIDELVKCKRIITTSLHGIILSEAYGIPAILVKDSRSDFNLLKYNDYYYSTGRYNYIIADSVDEAIEMPSPELPDIKILQKNVINSFPKDLWSD